MTEKQSTQGVKKHVMKNLQHKQLVKITKIIASYYWPWRYENTLLQWYNIQLHRRVQRTQIERTPPFNGGFHYYEEIKK